MCIHDSSFLLAAAQRFWTGFGWYLYGGMDMEWYESACDGWVVRQRVIFGRSYGVWWWKAAAKKREDFWRELMCMRGGNSAKG
ncbi:hypothetical protein EV1_034214 [Malus domestica]